MLTGIAAALLHIDIVVQNIERSIEIYTTLFGFEIVEDCVVETDAALFLSGGATRRMRLVFLSLGNRSSRLELIQLLGEDNRALPASTEGRFDWNLTFLVHNLDIAKSRLLAAGLRQVSPDYDVDLPKLGKARVIFCRDTDGNLIELVAPHVGPG